MSLVSTETGHLLHVYNQRPRPTQPPTLSDMGNEYQPMGSALCGKVTVGLASHRPCITDSEEYPSTGSMAQGSEMSTPLPAVRHTMPFVHPTPRADAYNIQVGNSSNSVFLASLNVEPVATH